MTKLESGAVSAERRACTISPRSSAATLRRAGRILSHHRVELDLAADLPMVELDAVLFEQVLFNLLDNAAKYAAAGDDDPHPELARPATPSACESSMKANGIPQDDLEHIFDKFYRAQKTDQVRAGTGLGLAISRGFVEAMHGTIVAANRTDRTRRRVHHQPADPARTPTPGRRRMNAAPLRVLVVDDEPPIRKLLRMGLSAHGYQILEAPNGKTALELLAKLRI